MKLITFFSVLMLCLVPTLLAQDAATCPIIVESAVASADEACHTLGRNQACYGNVTLEAEAYPDLPDFTFDQPGDIAEVMGIKTLRLSSLDTTEETWGVALMKLQANLPDTLPGQNVTVVLFGDVQLENQAGDDETPMQAFYFTSGLNDAPCEQAPDSGLLIQTPAGAGKVELSANEALIQLGSTLYIQAQPGGVMTFYVLEGEAEIKVRDVRRTIPAGAKLSVPLSNNKAASLPFGAVEPYSLDEVQALPLALLERVITIAEPLSGAITVDDQTNGCMLTAAKAVNLRSGPGTNYPRAGGLDVGAAAEPNGQAQGADGLIWWRLPGDKWVRSDVISALGDCNVVSLVTDLPPVPTVVPVTTGGENTNSNLPNSVVFSPGGCTAEVQVGRVKFFYGAGGAASCEEAKAAVGGSVATFSGSGPAPDQVYQDSDCHRHGPGNVYYGVDTLAYVNLSPGVYTYTADWIHGPRTCTITAR